MIDVRADIHLDIYGFHSIYSALLNYIIKNKEIKSIHSKIKIIFLNCNLKKVKIEGDMEVWRYGGMDVWRYGRMYESIYADDYKKYV